MTRHVCYVLLFLLYALQPPVHRAAPVLVVHGDQREALIRLRKEAEPFPNVKLFQVRESVIIRGGQADGASE